ncbi:uncharacterized protein LOC126902535 isoform X2 [Daktulosphaira vitifoliae]|uniref:uncharacterized protein LOC126902535 isoform X2 n=1 Tax=Daktulosphaira vitifoliae TaxID=58002 RepID=UPI0021A9A606|nr:uncharacterized protein LOC126902535 isoform X2 [Daktulosphaira vitifoliae]
MVLSVLLSLSSLVLVTSHPDAAILTDSRYQSNDGAFGAAYSQADGSEFKEESDAEGNRRGSYSYIDPSGQRRTVTYTAGKDGFKATGDHLPVAPTTVPTAPTTPTPKAQWEDEWSQPIASLQWNTIPKYNGNQFRSLWNGALASGLYEGQWNQWESISTTPKNDQWNQWNHWNSVPTAKQIQWNSVPTPKQIQWNSASVSTVQPTSYTVSDASAQFKLNRSPDGYSFSLVQS